MLEHHFFFFRSLVQMMFSVLIVMLAYSTYLPVLLGGWGLVVKGSKGGQGTRSVFGQNGTRRLHGNSQISHLYSPKVQSSSFMGWISGSACASSFSFTGTRETDKNKNTF